MNMNATVISSRPGILMVRDSETGMEVQVSYRQSNRFRTGDNVQITYSGAMTRSIPPQITAASIRKVAAFPTPLPQPVPPQVPEIRAVILQKSQNSLLVRDTNDGRTLRVNYRYAHHFCVLQRVIIRYDIITRGNPPQVNALDVRPVCQGS